MNIEEIIDFDPFAGNILEKAFPATESQKEVLASCLLGGNSASLAYNESLSLDLFGSLNTEALIKVLNEVVARHESLRASFSEDGQQMMIYEAITIQASQQDLQDRTSLEQQSFLQQWHQQDAETLFDLLNGPLIRFALFSLSPKRHLLTISAHHIICDGWSFGILLEDIAALYNAKILEGQPPKMPLQFSHYAQQVAAFEQTRAYRSIVDYWKKQYEGSIPVFEIPTDYPRPSVRTYKSFRDDYIMPQETAVAIKKAGAKYGCSFVTTLLAVFEILLYKYSGQEDIVIGLPTAGQSATEMYNMIGHCVNLLPLKSHPDPKLTVSEYFKQRKSQTLQDYENQQFTFGSFLKELKIPRDLSRMPLAPVSFNIDMGMDTLVQFTNLNYQLIHNKRIAETFELFLNIADCEEGYVFQWSYNAQLYKPSTMKGLMDKYNYLLTQIITNADQKIASLRLEDSSTIASFWQGWNNRQDDSLYQGTIIDKLHQSFINNANRVALNFEGTTITYKELDERTNQMAHLLIANGVIPAMVVGVAMERSIDLVVSILGVVKAGATFVPLDPQYAIERIAYMLDNAAASVLLTSALFKGKLQAKAKEICVDEIHSELSGYSIQPPSVAITPQSIVYILYTSGSTGKPKGVMIANKSLVNYISWAVSYYLKGASGVLPLYTSISFDLTITSIFAPLVSGSEIKIFREDDPAIILEKIFTDTRLNVIKLTPSHLKLVRDSEYIKRNLPNQHRTLIVGGEELETVVANDIYNLCQGNVLICNEYGPTEATVGCMIYNFNPSETNQAVPIGVPIPNASIYILDAQLNPVPRGMVGEIYIGGVCVSEGYYNNKQLTQERFLEDPFVPDSRMYKTGDSAVMLENDQMMFKGRNDDQIKLRGYRIELGEITHHLAALPDVENTVTIAREDTPGNMYIVSYLTLKNPIEDSENCKLVWRNILRSKLPDYMIPAAFVILKELPLTTNGKIDKKRLPAPEMQAQQYVAPQTPEEQLVASIWSEIFDKEKIGIHDNFFEMGGHSMVAVKVMRRIKNEMNIDLPIASLFQHPTIASLSSIIRGKEKIKHEILVKIKGTGTKPPIYLIHGGSLNILLYKNLEPFLSEDQPLYGIQALGLDGDLSFLSDIETISKRYLEEILKQNPNGPYAIVGYSLGGLIAFEITKQLLAMGKTIHFFGIFDTNVSNREASSSTISTMWKFAQRQIKKAVFIGTNLLQSPKEVIDYQFKLFKRKVYKNFEEEDDEQIYDYSEQVVNAYDRAYEKYVLTPVEVLVHLFRVKERIYFVDDMKYLGWNKYAQRGVKLHDVHGDHKTFLLEPNNKTLIRELEKALKQTKVDVALSCIIALPSVINYLLVG